MYQNFYQKFIEAQNGQQHYAAHSHHYWPDVTFAATQQYWLDSARLIDDKWGYIFSEKIPATQKLIANVLSLSKPEQIVFAPNTHELVYRLLSCFFDQKKVRVLTTDSEFHSFERQINRLSESTVPTFEIEKISTLEFATFEKRFIEKIKSNEYDMIFFSQVFFNSGLAVQNLKAIVDAVANAKTMIVVDAYHAFMALPTDLQALEDRLFYIAGSYKYAQGGEGCCFMTVPMNCQLRPSYTGWFASFDELASRDKQVKYSDNAYRFAGSTMDFTALYRLEAVLKLFQDENINVTKIHEHILKLQNHFLVQLNNLGHTLINKENILQIDNYTHGHFFSFELKKAELAKNLHDSLKASGIWTDYRGSRLRFGFGLYQNENIDFSGWVKSGQAV